MKGVILKAVGGFYYIREGDRLISCKARGRFRHEGITPLVGDWAEYTRLSEDTGVLEGIQPRKNVFFRPPVANIDQLVIFASETIPRTDPYLIDRVSAVGELQGCSCIICINKCDLDDSDRLYAIYQKAGFQTLKASAKTGEGVDQLHDCLRGRISVFTGNSGVGKSSMLNCMFPGCDLQVGEVSEKLGRGRHTTRHVELFEWEPGTIIADTPGFASFDVHQDILKDKKQLQHAFPEFSPYLDQCRFRDCAHIKEQGCAVRQAVEEGQIPLSRYESYKRLYAEV